MADPYVTAPLSQLEPLLLWCTTFLPLLWAWLFILASICLVRLHRALLTTACTRPLPHLWYVVTSCPHCRVSIPRFYVGLPWSSLVCPWLLLPILAVKEMLPDEECYLGLHSIFTVLPFCPSGSSVVPVVLIIHMGPDHLGAHLHVQTLVERSNRSSWQVYF